MDWSAIGAACRPAAGRRFSSPLVAGFLHRQDPAAHLAARRIARRLWPCRAPAPSALSRLSRLSRADLDDVGRRGPIWPPFDAWLVPLPVLTTPAVMLAGNCSWSLAFVRVARLNLSMGAPWRSGAGRPGRRAGPLLSQMAPSRVADIRCWRPSWWVRSGCSWPSHACSPCSACSSGLRTLVRQADVEERELAQPPRRRWAGLSCRSAPKWPWSRHARNAHALAAG